MRDRDYNPAATRAELLWFDLRYGGQDLSGLVKRSFSLAGHRTSVALEAEFWAALSRLAQARGQSLSALVAALDASRTPDRPLASALRVMALLAQHPAPP